MVDASDVALIIEGGGMRCSYTAGLVEKFIEEEIDFGWVGGISAGATHALNYLSRDAARSKTAFTEFASYPEFGGWNSFIKGKGFFNAEYIYQRSAEKDLPFDFDTLAQHPAQLHLEAVRADTGETVAWTREDWQEPEELYIRVRASSTLPLIMRIPVIDGVAYIDGGFGDSAGLLIDAAEEAGFKKFFVIATRPRDFVRGEVKRPDALRRVLRRWPAVAETAIRRPGIYNAVKEKILRYEAEGKAAVFFPDVMPISVRELNLEKLQETYELGQQQVEREWEDIKAFLKS